MTNNPGPFHSPGPFGGGSTPSGHGAHQHTPAAPASPPPGVAGDYRYGEVAAGGRKNLRRQEVSPLRAPWPLVIAGALVALSSIFLVYRLTDRWINDPAARDFTAGTGLIIIGVVVGVAAAVLTLRTHQLGRIALTVWSIVALISLIGQLWPVGIAAIAVLVLIWLPASSKWIF